MAYGRIYKAIMPAIAVTAAKDLMRLKADTDHILVIHEVVLTQETLETDEQLPVVLQRVSTDGTGTATTIVAAQEGDPAFGGTCIHNLTVDSTAGDVLHREGFNLKSGFFWLPPPELRIVVPPSGRFTLRLPTAPAASTTFTGVITFEVIGGA
jgi:hypothetical protein